MFVQTLAVVRVGLCTIFFFSRLRIESDVEGPPAASHAAIPPAVHAHARGGVVPNAAKARKDRAVHVVASSTAEPQAS